MDRFGEIMVFMRVVENGIFLSRPHLVADALGDQQAGLISSAKRLIKRAKALEILGLTS